MTDSTITGWHFSNGRLRDGRPIVVGQWERYEGSLQLCKSGYHLSVRAIDALEYAPGPYVGRAEGQGDIVYGRDKVVCSERRYTTEPLDATVRLRWFARWCAIQALHLWDPPEIVTQYLTSGDASLRAAACEASQKAAWASMWWEPAWASAWASARVASPEPVWALARATAQEAAWATARVRATAREVQNTKLEELLLAPADPKPVIPVSHRSQS